MLYNFPKTSDFDVCQAFTDIFSLLPALICVKTSQRHPPLITLQRHLTHSPLLTLQSHPIEKPSHIFNSLIKIDAQILPQLPHVSNSPTLLLPSLWRLLLSSTPPSTYNVSKSPTRHLKCSKIIKSKSLTHLKIHF